MKKQGFRIASKKFLLTYPKTKDIDGTTVTLDKQTIATQLKSVFESRTISRLLIAEEKSDNENEYEHFHVIVTLEYRKNIINSRLLDINGVHGNYVAVRNLKLALKYVKKGDDFLDAIGTEREDNAISCRTPFSKFCYKVKHCEVNPSALLLQVRSATKYEEELFDMYVDYMKSPDKYDRVVKDNTKPAIKKRRAMYIREDIYNGLIEWNEAAEKNDWFNTVLFLEGPSGIGKTTLVRILTNDLFLEVKHFDQAKKFN